MTFTSGGQPSHATIAFLWNNVCNVPGWCAQGSNAYGWGTVDGLRARVFGYSGGTTPGTFRRDIYVGEPSLSTGRWDSSVLSGDRQRLVITSSDFAWDDRRGVTIELTRAPWPADVPCPVFRNCSAY